MTNENQAAARLACPVCRRACDTADLSAVCSRCGADLALYRAAATQAQTLLRQAAAHLRTSPEIARQLTNRAARLHTTTASCRMQALAALCAGDYAVALTYRAKARCSVAGTG